MRLFILPRLYHDAWRCYRRRANPLNRLSVLAHPYLYTRIERLMPGIWYAVGIEFSTSETQFQRGRPRRLHNQGERLQ